MTNEEKELLLKDLCGRLPYGVKIQVWSYWNGDYFDMKLLGIDLDEGDVLIALPGDRCEIEKVKPYLRPMESMTEEEKIELLKYMFGEEGLNNFHITNDGIVPNGYDEGCVEVGIGEFNLHWINFSNSNVARYEDWLDKNMFDYRGLIPMGLALPAEEGMYNG